MAKITKMLIRSPQNLFKGFEEDRERMPRNEGPEIVLHFSSEDFNFIEYQISQKPIADLDPHSCLTGDNGRDRDYQLIDGGRDGARKKWRELNSNNATLHESPTHTIHARIGDEPNTLVIMKRERDIADPSEHDRGYGLEGTRAFEAADLQLIPRALQTVSIDIPSNFEQQLREGIAKATPRRATIIEQNHQVLDMPGESFEVDFTTTQKQR